MKEGSVRIEESRDCYNQAVNGNFWGVEKDLHCVLHGGSDAHRRGCG
jgi:hypothetical protein